jgi:site-specific recombinase XerD
VREVVPRTCALAEGSEPHLHSLWHPFASHLVMRGVQLLAVKELLGRTTLAQVLIYFHLGPNITRDAIRLLDGDNVATG